MEGKVERQPMDMRGEKEVKIEVKGARFLGLEYSAHGGAFPVFVEGTGLVGAVVVSGLPQEEDHAPSWSAYGSSSERPEAKPPVEARQVEGVRL